MEEWSLPTLLRCETCGTVLEMVFHKEDGASLYCGKCNTYISADVYPEQLFEI